MFENRLKRLRFFDKWYDEYGNSISFSKDGKVNCTYHDLSIDRKNNPSTDIYAGISIDKVYKISKLVHCYYGKDEDLNKNFCLLTFLGIDNYLRSYLFYQEECKQVSPLLMGFDNLIEFSNLIGIQNFCHFKMKENNLPCKNGKAWLSCLPVSEKLFHIIETESDYLSTIFKEK